MALFQKLFSAILGPRVAAAIGMSRSLKEEQESMRRVVEAKKAIAEKDKEIQESLRKQLDRKEAERRMREEFRRRQIWFRFVDLGVPLRNGLDFTSSNVDWIQYDIEGESLYVSYRTGHNTDGRTYRYWTVNERLAIAAFNSISKGKFVWENLRIRGTLLGHRLNYALIEQGRMPLKWTETVSSILAHERQVGTESGSPPGTIPTQTESAQPYQIGQTGKQKPYKALGKFSLPEPKVT